MNRNNVKSRNLVFTNRPISKIWQETASKHNPYLADSCHCHGYDLFELFEKRSFVDVFFLLFQGELPTYEQARLLESLMIFLINPGPRHPATRAAMVTGVSKTDPAHLLPISLSILGGSHLGAGEIERTMVFLQARSGVCPEATAREMLHECRRSNEGDWHPAPGFGSRFGGIDPFCQRMAEHLTAMPGAGQSLRWGNSFAAALEVEGVGWLLTGLAAAAMIDLGFHPKAGTGLYQILCAPGLLAHSIEFVDKPITAMPFLKDEEYFIENE